MMLGPDIDWRGKCRPGDQQGETDACTVFAIANWCECMLGADISDDDAIEVWRAERQFRYRDLAGGLTVPEAFAAAMIRARWMPSGTTIRRVGDLTTLPLAPLVATFDGLDWAIQPGTCLLSRLSPGSKHAALVVGFIAGVAWIENSHGQQWGENGFACMDHDTFRRHATQIWQIIMPGAPRTIQEIEQGRLAALADQIRDQVTSLTRNLRILGYSLPGDGRIIMTDVIRRSLAGQLTPPQQDARRDVTDVYLILQGSGITDAQINAVWAYINTAQEQP